MPELPEVETIRLGLQKHLVGHTIKDIEIHLPKQVRGDSNKLIGGKVITVRRFGKGLVIDFDNHLSLAIHVKMTGQLLYTKFPKHSDAQGLVHAETGPVAPHLHSTSSASPAGGQWGTPSRATRSEINLPDKYTHVVFHLDNDAVLYYRDIRQFGWLHVLPTEEISKHSFFKSLGPEPLKDLTLKTFSQLLKQTKTPIKVLLMDQAKIAGIGNIYANDALYLAKINPLCKADSLTPHEVKELFKAIETVLQKGIAVGGASERDYVNVLGGQGKYQNFFLVYHKDGKPCPRCGTLIERIKLGGRGTFVCFKCQK